MSSINLNSNTSSNSKSKFVNSLVPMVIKKSVDGERAMDIFSRLLDERIIMLTEPFEDQMASLIVSQLLYLQSEDSKKDITMYINSPGGSVTSMWSIIDTMNLIKPDVSTVCIGMAASAASLTLAAGAKGKRFILPNARVMIHQPMGGFQGQVTDAQIVLDQLVLTKQKLIEFLVERTNMDKDTISKDVERDYYMQADEVVKYGIVDKVLGK
jgi:ATP-dependent Clp protease, protease subunit